MDVRVGLWRKLSAEELMLLNSGVGQDSWESLGLQDPTSPFWRRSALVFLWREWCWSWNSSTLATSCEQLTHWERLWCWEGLGAGGEGDDRGWDGWMASQAWWTWVWVNSGSWWWTGRPGVLRFMGSQRVRHDWVTELNWNPLFQCKEAMLLFDCHCFPLCTDYHGRKKWWNRKFARVCPPSNGKTVSPGLHLGKDESKWGFLGILQEGTLNLKHASIQSWWIPKQPATLALFWV